MPLFLKPLFHRQIFTTKEKEFKKLFANALFRAICEAFSKKGYCKKKKQSQNIIFEVGWKSNHSNAEPLKERADPVLKLVISTLG